jgi:hypothetical protein
MRNKKYSVSSFSFPRDKEEIVEQAEEIANRERSSLSRLIISLLEDYVRTHAAGNPSFELNKWIEKPEFIGDPALRESNDKWDRYLDSCDEKDLQQLMGTFQKRLQQTNQSWKKKKGFTR